MKKVTLVPKIFGEYECSTTPSVDQYFKERHFEEVIPEESNDQHIPIIIDPMHLAVEMHLSKKYDPNNI